MGSPIPTEVLDDLCSRFIINVPEEERTDLVRICFQIELAHWFYIDFYSKGLTKKKKSIGINEFAGLVFRHIPSLEPYVKHVDSIIDAWKEYKFAVPTFGAILLNEQLTHVLLVQSYCSKTSWGFPKGKINKGESPWQCAIREVFEETGFDITSSLDPSEYIEASCNDQVVRLYIIPGISMNQQFQPQTRNEIKAINWFPISDLPATKKEAACKIKSAELGSNSFFMVTPFIRKLRHWLYEHCSSPRKGTKRPRYKSWADSDSGCKEHEDWSGKSPKIDALLNSYGSSNERSGSDCDGSSVANCLLRFQQRTLKSPQNQCQVTNIRSSENDTSSTIRPLPFNEQYKTIFEKLNQAIIEQNSLALNGKAAMPNCHSIEYLLLKNPQANPSVISPESLNNISINNQRQHIITIKEKTNNIPNGYKKACMMSTNNNNNFQQNSKTNSNPLSELINQSNLFTNDSLNQIQHEPNQSVMINDNQFTYMPVDLIESQVSNLENDMQRLNVAHPMKSLIKSRSLSNDENRFTDFRTINHNNESSSFVEVVKHNTINSKSFKPVSNVIIKSSNNNGQIPYNSVRSLSSLNYFEIGLSESFNKYGIRSWANFEFDKSVIIASLNEIV